MAGENIGASLVPVSGCLQPSAVPASADALKAPTSAELQAMQASKAFAKVIVVSMSGRISRTRRRASCAARFVAMDGKEVRIMDAWSAQPSGCGRGELPPWMERSHRCAGDGCKGREGT